MKNNDGYTLVESLVAMTLFATVVLGLIGGFGLSFKSNHSSQLESALILAQSELAGISKNELTNEKKVVGNFTVERTIETFPRLYVITVKVSSVKDEEKPLVELTTVIAAYADEQ